MHTDYRDRLSVKICKSSDNCRIIAEVTIAVHLHEIIKNRVHIVHGSQTLHLSCGCHLIPGLHRLCLHAALAHQLSRLITVILTKWIKICISCCRAMHF